MPAPIALAAQSLRQREAVLVAAAAAAAACLPMPGQAQLSNICMVLLASLCLRVWIPSMAGCQAQLQHRQGSTCLAGPGNDQATHRSTIRSTDRLTKGRSGVAKGGVIMRLSEGGGPIAGRTKHEGGCCSLHIGGMVRTTRRADVPSHAEYRHKLRLHAEGSCTPQCSLVKIQRSAS